MTPYPSTLPIDAATVLINAATQGFAPDGTHGDMACCILAGWNIQGFGLSVWKPHDPDIMGAKGKAKASAAPKGEKAQLKALAKLLTPAASAHGTEGAPAQDAAAIPWATVIAILTALLQAWLKK